MQEKYFKLLDRMSYDNTVSVYVPIQRTTLYFEIAKHVLQYLLILVYPSIASFLYQQLKRKKSSNT